MAETTDRAGAGPACRDDPERAYDDNRIAEAKAVCLRCPVLATCRGLAMQVREPWGVWGGLTVAERERHHAGAAIVACAGCGLDCVPATGGLCSACAPAKAKPIAGGTVSMDANRGLITSLSLDGWPVPDIAALIGCNRESVRQAQIRWDLPNTPAPMGPRPAGRELRPCGTPAAQRRHQRRKEDCAVCREAEARRVQDDWNANLELRHQQQAARRRSVAA